MESKLEIVEESGVSRVYLKMVIQGTKCKICSKIMLPKVPHDYSPFPKFVGANQDYQMKQMGLVYESNREVNSEAICVECVANDRAYFDCYICNKSHGMSKAKESIGSSSPDFMCTDCYEVTPAKKWDEIKKELEKEHFYDNM